MNPLYSTHMCVHTNVKFLCYMIFRSELKLSEVTQLCLTLCDPMDCSLPGSSIYGIFQARVLERGAIAFSEYSCKSKQFYQARCLDTVAYNKCLSNEYKNIPLTVHRTSVPIKMVEKNANQNHNEVPLHTSQNGCDSKICKQ